MIGQKVGQRLKTLLHKLYLTPHYQLKDCLDYTLKNQELVLLLHLVLYMIGV